MLHALGEEWEPEMAIPTGMPRESGYPTCYKIDLANPQKKIGLEFDGKSHCATERKAQDAKKDALLASLGWLVYRISNERALSLYSTCESAGTLLTSLMGT
jgi:hypothetical protein